MLKPIQRQSISGAVFELLQHQIIDGTLAPGSTLPSERELAEQLGVNRGAVREALKRLEQQRLVSIQHGGATRVLDFRNSSAVDLLVALLVQHGRVNPKVARSISELVDLITPDTARLAAIRGGAEAAKRLELKVAEIEAARDDRARLYQLRWGFWEIVVGASDNIAHRLLFNLVRETFSKLDRMSQGGPTPTGDDPGFARRLIQAIAEGNGDEAERCTRDFFLARSKQFADRIEAHRLASSGD